MATTEIAAAYVEALADEVFQRVAQRFTAIKPVTLDRQRAAEFLGISPETLRKMPGIRPIFLEGCSKPLYRVADLEQIVEFAQHSKI